METKKDNTEREVLFQKLGTKWYVFTEIGNDFVYSALPEGIDPRTTKLELFNVIEDHLERVSKHKAAPEAAA